MTEDPIKRLIDEAITRYGPPSPDDAGPGIAPTVKRMGYYMPVSEDVLMDEGLIPDTRPKPDLTRRQKLQRLRWRLDERIDRWRLRLGSWIAGTDLDHECEPW